MQTLSFGFKEPETGDKGSVFFPALEDNIAQLNSHDHNGTNSKKLTSSSITTTTQAVLAANWASEGSGFSQTVTIAGGLQYDDYFVAFKLDTGEQIFPTVEKVSATQFKVYVNDNALELTAYYTS